MLEIFQLQKVYHFPTKFGSYVHWFKWSIMKIKFQDPDVGKDRSQREKGMAEDEKVRASPTQCT